MSQVAFIGLGAMGSRMAQRLLDAGHELTVWNRTAAKAEALAAAGARVAASAAEAAADGDFVITMVRDGPALDAVTAGSDGVFAGLRAGAVFIDMSTIGPDAAVEIAARVPSHAAFVDAPVLGSLSEAAAGELRVFVGAEADVFARVRPVLKALGEPTHVGPLGAGAAAKLVANSTLFAVVAALGEALAAAEALGLAREEVFAVLAATPLAAQAERRRAAIEAGDYAPRFPVELARKDADLVVDAARVRGLELSLAEAARAYLVEAEANGWSDCDYSGLIGWLLARAGASKPLGRASPPRHG